MTALSSLANDCEWLLGIIRLWSILAVIEPSHCRYQCLDVRRFIAVSTISMSYPLETWATLFGRSNGEKTNKGVLIDRWWAFSPSISRLCGFLAVTQCNNKNNNTKTEIVVDVFCVCIWKEAGLTILNVQWSRGSNLSRIRSKCNVFMSSLIFWFISIWFEKNR